MAKDKFTVIRIKTETAENLSFWKKLDESWPDFMERFCNTFEAALKVIEADSKPIYSTFVSDHL